MSNEFIDGIRHNFDEGENDPYINPRDAEEAIREDYPNWQFAIESGIGDYESASLMAAFGVENPFDVSEVGLNFDEGAWSLSIAYGGDYIEIDIADQDLPFWVWDWLYDMADDFGWDWEITYTGEGA